MTGEPIECGKHTGFGDLDGVLLGFSKIPFHLRLTQSLGGSGLGGVKRIANVLVIRLPNAVAVDSHW